MSPPKNPPPTLATLRSVSVVGLGLVGCALALRLRMAGWTVCGYDIDPTARDRFTSQGFATAPSLSALRAPVAILAVFDSAGTCACLEGPDNLLANPALRHVIDCSTGDPAQLHALAWRLKARDVALIEAPLSGSSQQIAQGEALALLGGDVDDVAAMQPLITAIAPRYRQVGAAGSGAKAKLATNLVLGLNRAALAEGMVLAERLGIAPALFLELVQASAADSVAARQKGQKMVQADYTPQSRVHQHLKDVELMLAAAREHAQALPLTQAHAGLLRDLVDHGQGGLDNAAIIEAIRRITLKTDT
jgi:3-hydroxyisobutyrate dehydrogenase-like beta-hydroxyacid dehydrogenase